MLAIKWRPQHLNGTFVKGKQRGCSIFQKKKNKKNPQLHNWTPHDAPPPPTTTNVQWPSDCLAISSILLKLLAFSGLLSTRRLYVVLTAIQFCLDSIRFDTIRFDFFFFDRVFLLHCLVAMIYNIYIFWATIVLALKAGGMYNWWPDFGPRSFAVADAIHHTQSEMNWN